MTATAASSVQGTVTVNVIGTGLVIYGPTSLPVGATGITFNVVLTDAGGDGISGQQVTVSSSSNNGLSQTALLTDNDGQASFTYSATVGGNDTLTATALGLQATLVVNVSNDVFAFETPAAGTEVPLNTPRSVTVHWEDAGGDVVGDTVTFTTTRGAIAPLSGVATTDGFGNATVSVSATNAGPAVLTATNALNTSTTRNIEFVATVPDALELQANPFTVPTNDQSTITAIVRDANGNLVKNQTVSFSLADVTGGSLSVAQAVTNSQGRAQTFYTASSTTSQVDGVRIDATVVGTSPAVTDAVFLTVAQRELFISIGTGNEIFPGNSSAQYRKEWVVQVTDANGNGVQDVDLSLSVLSERYWDGQRAYYDPPGAWLTQRGIEALPAAGCLDEDVNRNGILDVNPDEDFNSSGRIEAGNIATAVAQSPASGNPNSILTTDANGFAVIDVFWPEEYAYWLEVTLQVQTSVQGTEFAESTTFMLVGMASDFTDENTSPPGESSPFGLDGNCGTYPPNEP